MSVKKTKSNFGGIDKEIYKFRMWKGYEISKNPGVFLGLSGS